MGEDDGVKLRDLIAIRAMAQLMAADLEQLRQWDTEELVDGWDYGDAQRWARDSYLIADCIMAARDGREWKPNEQVRE